MLKRVDNLEIKKNCGKVQLDFHLNYKFTNSEIKDEYSDCHHYRINYSQFQTAANDNDRRNKALIIVFCKHSYIFMDYLINNNRNLTDCDSQNNSF